MVAFGGLLVFFFGFYPSMQDYKANKEKLETIISSKGSSAIHKMIINEGTTLVGSEVYAKIDGQVISSRNFDIVYKVKEFTKKDVVLQGYLNNKPVEKITLEKGKLTEIPRTNGWKVQIDKIKFDDQIIIMTLHDR